MTTPEPEPGGLPEQTINRNWTELIQELRSTQTGVQVLTGFLLAVPFTDRFHTLDHVERTAYLIVLTGAVSASMAVLAPIAYHRILFRRDRRPWLVESGQPDRPGRAGARGAHDVRRGVPGLRPGRRPRCRHRRLA